MRLEVPIPKLDKKIEKGQLPDSAKIYQAAAQTPASGIGRRGDAKKLSDFCESSYIEHKSAFNTICTAGMLCAHFQT